MKNRFYPEILWIACALVAAGIGWLLVRKGATPNSPAAVEAALRQAHPTDLESVTVYPLVPGQQAATRPFQVRAPAQLRQLLPALQQLRPIKVAEGTFQPLLEATVVVRLTAPVADAAHLHSRDLSFRLASSDLGAVAQLAQTNNFYQAAALSQRIAQLRDSVARR